MPSAGQTASTHYPISARLRLSNPEQVLLLVSMLFYQDATVVYCINNRALCIQGGLAPHSELKIIKVVYSLSGKSRLALQMRYIHSVSAKWSSRPRHHGQMITCETPHGLLLLMDTVGQDKIRSWCEKGSEGTLLIYLAHLLCTIIFTSSHWVLHYIRYVSDSWCNSREKVRQGDLLKVLGRVNSESRCMCVRTVMH